MSSRIVPDVALVGYQDQGNLGMGYLASALGEHGRTAELIDIRDGPESIAKRLISKQPLVVGFSLIFQYFLPQYRRLASFLRQAGSRSGLEALPRFHYWPAGVARAAARFVPSIPSTARRQARWSGCGSRRK